MLFTPEYAFLSHFAELHKMKNADTVNFILPYLRFILNILFNLSVYFTTFKPFLISQIPLSAYGIRNLYVILTL